MAKEITPSFSSLFEYIPKNIESNVSEVLGRISTNLLDFQEKFQKGDFLDEELEMIASELVSTAQYFGAQQGLGGSKLLDNKFLRARVLKNKTGEKTILFTNSAQDEHNRYYAGFVEYGHYNKNRKGFVEARPFMRPALYAVSKSSQGQIKDVFSDLLGTIFRGNGTGYQGVSNLSFGNKLGSRDSRGAKSTQTVNLLKQGPKRWPNKRLGKWGEFRDQPGFEKSMNQFSIKRGSVSKLQRRQKRDIGFGRKGVNLHKAKQKAKYLSSRKSSLRKQKLYEEKIEKARIEREKFKEEQRIKNEIKREKWKELRYNPKRNGLSHEEKVAFGMINDIPNANANFYNAGILRGGNSGISPSPKEWTQKHSSQDRVRQIKEKESLSSPTSEVTNKKLVKAKTEDDFYLANDYKKIPVFIKGEIEEQWVRQDEINTNYIFIRDLKAYNKREGR